MQTIKNNILLTILLLIIVGQSSALSFFSCSMPSNHSDISLMEVTVYTTSSMNLNANLDIIDSSQSLNSSDTDCCADEEDCYMTGCSFSIANYLPLSANTTLSFQALAFEKSMKMKQFSNPLYRPPMFV